MRSLLFAAVLVAACHGNDPAKGGAGTASSAPVTTPSTVPPAPAEAPKTEPPKVVDAPKVTDNGETKVAPDTKAPPAGGHDFTSEGKAMYVVGACGGGAPPEGFRKALIQKHCVTSYHQSAGPTTPTRWRRSRAVFFEANVPKDLPKTVALSVRGRRSVDGADSLSRRRRDHDDLARAGRRSSRHRRARQPAQGPRLGTLAHRARV